jgi:hypothetical protein
VYSRFPTSLQKNPRLELTVITEMTDAGRARPEVSPAHPAYFEVFSHGAHDLGDTYAGMKEIPLPRVQEMLTRALATNGYLPAERPAHPPTLLVTYTWGQHNRLTEPDEENPVMSSAQVERNLLDRAALVGGVKFAEELREAFRQKNDLALAGGSLVPMLDPIEVFKRRADNNEFLLEQAMEDVYYVVASAYDYEAAMKHQRVLLWRTRMTVASAGVAEDQSLPALVSAAAPYFGKDMPAPEVMLRREVKEGSVHVGTPRVVEDHPAEPAPPAH